MKKNNKINNKGIKILERMEIRELESLILRIKLSICITINLL